MKYKQTVIILLVLLLLSSIFNLSRKTVVEEIKKTNLLILKAENISQNIPTDLSMPQYSTKALVNTSALINYSENKFTSTSNPDIEKYNKMFVSQINAAISEYNKAHAPKPASPVDYIEWVKSRTETLGDSGRLYIPSVGVNVALYYGRSQKRTDAWDSAAYFKLGVQMCIADHNYQGFNAMKRCSIGTLAYIKKEDSVEVYRCIDKFNATNTGANIEDANGTMMSKINDGGLIMYTCNDCWQNVTVTLWRKQ